MCLRIVPFLFIVFQRERRYLADTPDIVSVFLLPLLAGHLRRRYVSLDSDTDVALAFQCHFYV